MTSGTNSSQLSLGELPQRQVPDTPPRGQPQGYEVRRRAQQQLSADDNNQNLGARSNLQSLDWGKK
jgi:hypothetical protein